MSDLYCDSAAPGANDGSSWADAYTSIETAALAAATAGDTVHVAASAVYTLSTATLTLGGTGTASNYVRWIGYNASHVADGTRVVVDANSAYAVAISFGSGQDFYYLANFHVKNATVWGFQGQTSTTNVTMVNCASSGNAGNAINGFLGSTFIRCDFFDSLNGVGNPRTQNQYIDCNIYDNSGDGIEGVNTQTIFVKGGIIRDNTTYGLLTSDGGVYSGITIHGNGSDGINSPRDPVVIDSCRITDNGGYGINIGSVYPSIINTYIPDAGEDLANTSGAVNGSYFDLSDSGIDLNNLAGTDTDGGYTDSSADNFNLVSDATLRSVELDIDGTNSDYKTAGLKPSASGGGGGGVYLPNSRIHNA